MSDEYQNVYMTVGYYEWQEMKQRNTLFERDTFYNHNVYDFFNKELEKRTAHLNAIR